MSHTIRVLLICFASALGATTANATCWQSGTGARATHWQPSVSEEFQEARFVFVGRAMHERNVFSAADPDDYDWTIYDVEVVQAFKGKPPHMIRLLSENSSARFTMEPGKTYLLFVNHMPMDERDGEETLPHDFVDNCGNSGVMEAAGEKIKTVELLSASH